MTTKDWEEYFYKKFKDDGREEAFVTVKSLAHDLNNKSDDLIRKWFGVPSPTLSITPKEMLSLDDIPPQLSYLDLWEDFKLLLGQSIYISRKQKDAIISWLVFGQHNHVAKKEDCEIYIDLLKQGYYKYITMNDRKDLILCLSNVVKFVRASPNKSYLLYENSCCSEINPHVKKVLRKAGAWNLLLLGKRLKVVVPVSKRSNFDIQFEEFLENNNEFNKDMFVISEIILMQCKSHDVRC